MDPKKVQHAKAYPFTRWTGSYLFVDGEVRDFDVDVREGRIPVLASGSNAAPDRLRQKFGDEAVIPVEAASLHDFDAVYSAHFAEYGSVPATLHPAPGVVVDLFVTWLDADQLEVMHISEYVGKNYDYMTLEDIRLDLEHGTLNEAHAYISLRGALSHQGRPVALSAVNAKGREHPAMDQEQVLRLVRDRLHPDKDLDRFIFEHVDDDHERERRARHLSADALKDFVSHKRK